MTGDNTDADGVERTAICDTCDEARPVDRFLLGDSTCLDCYEEADE